MRSCVSGVTPSVIVHRGHSTYVAQTIEKVQRQRSLWSIWAIAVAMRSLKPS